MRTNLVSFLLCCFIPACIFSQNFINHDVFNTFKNRKDDTAKVNQLNQIGSELSEKDPELSMKYAREAIQAAERIKYWQGKKNAYFILSSANITNENHREAFQYLDKAIMLAIKNKKAEEIVSCYMAYGNSYKRIGQELKAYESYRRALSFEEKIGNEKSLENIHSILAEFCRVTGRFQDAINYLKRNIILQTKLKENAKLYETYYNLGSVYVGMEKYKEAMECFVNALKIVENGSEYRKIGNAYSAMGVVYYSMEHFPEALNEFNKALMVFEGHQVKKALPAIHMNICNAYMGMKQYDTLLKHCDITLNLIRTTPGTNPVIEARIYDNYGIAYTEKKQYELAIAYYYKALAIFNKLGLEWETQYVHNNLGICYMRLKRYQEAKKEFLTELTLINNNQYERSLIALYRNFYMLDTLMGNFKDAFKHLTALHETQDTILTKENFNRIANIELKYQYERKLLKDSIRIRDEKIIQAKQLDLIQMEVREEKFKTGWLIVFIVVLLALLLFLVSKYRLYKHQRQLIEVQNLQYDTLLREIHHRVKNNLQVVSSIIELEAMRQSDTQAIQSFDDMRPRITSVSMVHTILYNQKRMQLIDVKNYFHELFENFEKAYSKNGKAVQFTTKIPSLMFNVKQMVPLALIITELITLSRKYAVNHPKTLLIDLSIEKVNYGVKLIYYDNNTEFNEARKEQVEKTLGYRLVSLLTKQLSGTLSQYMGADKYGFTIFLKLK